LGIAAAAIVLGFVAPAACTSISEPASLEAASDAGGLDGGDAAPDAPSSCPTSTLLFLRGAKGFFAPGPRPGTGAWRAGGLFAGTTLGAEKADITATVIGDVRELGARKVVLGQGKNAASSTFTHRIVLERDCLEDGGCAGGTYVARSGSIVATRLDTLRDAPFELVGADVLFWKATPRGDGFELSSDPSACLLVPRFVLAGIPFSLEGLCTLPDGPIECTLAKTSGERHPD
jgi:hypothetical protein